MTCTRACFAAVYLVPAAYYRGAMGILLVYDVTDEASFNNIRNWMRNIEQHASDNVNKVHLCAYCQTGSMQLPAFWQHKYMHFSA
jgi:hypothetical protein